jgi:hypothetical protein
MVLPQPIDDFLKNTVAAHYVLAAVAILILVVLVIYFAVKKEKFNPTATMYKVSQDQQYVGWTASENKERAEGGPAAAAGPKEGSVSWNVLHSDNFGCDKRVPVGDDAWTWMVGHSKDAETMRGGQLSDNEASALLAGRRPQ